jgi:hypothetical protein
MTILGCNVKQVQQFISEVEKVRERLKSDEEFLARVLTHQDEYLWIKSYFEEFVRYLRYPNEFHVKSLYRVRKCGDNDEPFSCIKDLSYPPPSIDHEDRMNNTAFRVLYTSFHEFTAMAETRIDSKYKDKYFQLTRFTTNKPIKVYRLGLFSELQLNSPRDSDYVKEETVRLFGELGHDKTIQGFSALECAIADVLYDVSDKYHLLSSILADAIFSINPDVDAIMYPSMQNRYGVNFAIKQEFADTMSIDYTCLNKLTDVYDNGFYRYITLKECVDISSQDELKFSEIDNSFSNSIYR